MVGNGDKTEMQSLTVLGVMGRTNNLIQRLTGAIKKALFYCKGTIKI